LMLSRVVYLSLTYSFSLIR